MCFVILIRDVFSPLVSSRKDCCQLMSGITAPYLVFHTHIHVPVSGYLDRVQRCCVVRHGRSEWSAEAGLTVGYRYLGDRQSAHLV